MKNRTVTIFAILHFLVWVAFISLLVESGALLVSYLFSVFKPEAARSFYKNLDFFELRQSNLLAFSVWVLFLIGISCLKSFTAYLVIQIFAKLKLTDPFKLDLAVLMERISYFIVGIWVASSLLALAKEVYFDHHFRLEVSSASIEYLFLAGIIFIFAQIFKKGVEIQSENDLTV